MGRKLPDEEAFSFYVGLGDQRSLGAVAKKYGVCYRAVTKAAKRGDWVQRLEKIEREAREHSDHKRAETLAEMRERHLKMARAIGARGAQALQAAPLDNAMQGVKAMELSIKLERSLIGERDERTSTSIEEVTRREVETFLAIEGEIQDDGDEGLVSDD